jgi:hypothetical protein
LIRIADWSAVGRAAGVSVAGCAHTAWADSVNKRAILAKAAFIGAPQITKLGKTKYFDD